MYHYYMWMLKGVRTLFPGEPLMFFERADRKRNNRQLFFYELQLLFKSSLKVELSYSFCYSSMLDYEGKEVCL